MKRLIFMIFLLVALALWVGCANDENDKDADNTAVPFDDAPRWGQLHGDGARTDSVRTQGIVKSPKLLFEIVDDKPSAFSGPVVGPLHETSFGVGGKVYRTLGPGPVSFNPPKGIAPIIGTTSAIQVIHPTTGEILNERKFNLGAFTNFAAVDTDGNVYMPDWGRLQKFSGGLVDLIWRNDFGGPVNGFGDVPAATVAFLPDGNIFLPTLSGRLYVFDSNVGTKFKSFDLNILTPPIAPDPQYAWAGILLRNAAVIDQNEIFLLVNGEMIRIQYFKSNRDLRVIERTSTMGFSSSTPTLDTIGKRLFIVTFDPNSPEEPPMLRCFDYATRPMTQRWSIETNLDRPDREDQLSVTYLPEQGIIINNSLYGHLSAYIETNDGGATQLWSTEEIIGENVAAYIGAATQPDGTVYFVENFSRTLYALHAESGEVLWTYPLPAQSIKTPIPNRGRLYIDHNWGMVALQGE